MTACTQISSTGHESQEPIVMLTDGAVNPTNNAATISDLLLYERAAFA